MRNKYLWLIILPLMIGLFSSVSQLPTANAQDAEPTIIYETDYEIDPATFVAPQTDYGNVANHWQEDCGVDASGCIYGYPLTGGGEAPGTQFAATVSYFEDTSHDVQESPFDWEACAVNFIEFDLLYVAPDNTDIGLEDNSRFKIWLSTGFSAGPGFATFEEEIPFAELDGAEQEQYFHVALPLDNTDMINSFAIEWRTSEIRTVDSTDNPVGIFESRVDNLKVWCDYQAQWIRPVAHSDESTQWEMFDLEYAGSLDGETFDSDSTWVNAFSTSYHAPVHSAHAGTVMSISPLVVGQLPCGDDAISLILNECIVFIPKEITNDSGGELYQLDLVNAYSVEVVFDTSYSLVYVLANAPNYVDIGDEIGEGCIIGETIQLKQILDLGLITVGGSAGTGGIGGGVGGTFQSTLTGTGYVAEQLTVSDADVRLYPRLNRYSTDDSPCMSTDPRFTNCLGNDPSLTQADGDGRSTSGNVTFDNPGYTLVSRNALIKEIDMLDADTEYGLSVDVEAQEEGGEIELKLGQTVESHFITAAPGETQTISIASDIHEPDLTDAWTIQVKNVSGASVKVLSICVSAGDVAGLPTACYFVNPSFDNGYANWDISEGVGQRDGSVTVPSGDTIAQEATLPADEPDTTFQLYVDVYIWTEPGVTIDRTDYTSTVGIEWRFPDSDADWTPLVGPSSQEDVTFSEFALEAERAGVTVGTIAYQGFITIDEDTTGTIEIRPTVTTETEGILGVGIDRACLRGDFGPPQVDPNGNCQNVTRPQDELLSSWTVWLWRHFDNFFQCDLMIVLRQIRNTTYSIYQLTGWSIRYWKTSYFVTVQWLSTSLFPWLNGQFANMARGSTSVFYINGNEGTNLWDFLVAIINGAITPLLNGLSSVINNLILAVASIIGAILNAITTIVTAILNTINILITAVAGLLGLIITGVFTLISTVLVLIFSLISDLFHVLMLIITGWNTSTPTPIPGLPSCETDPAGNYLCLPVYILNNTIFRPGTEGDVLLLLLVSYGCFELVMWVIGSIRQGFVDATRSA